LGEIKKRKIWVEAFLSLEKSVEDLSVLIEMSEEEGGLNEDLDKECKNVLPKLEDLEFKRMLNREDDDKGALLTIHPGAGGTESQDWAQMLFRMYNYWIDKKGFSKTVLDFLPGEEAGLKSATIEVNGDYAFGYLRAEIGVHRLVRISPFDSNARRHTSFVSIFVYPIMGDDVEIEIDSKDIRIDTYRASGAGGQHVNKTSSAVRLTHLETNIVVQCQNDRSQHKNKATAMKMLKSRLYQHYKELEEVEKAKKEGEKKKIEWGSQIRSYVFHPYNMVKDHRTNVETGNVQAVMNGELDQFIEAYLKEF